MAKKGGVQQLQTEVNTTEELIKFLERDGLIVLDVYTEWCGPCVAMVGSMKKIKLEQGGDDLHLAVVKCDQIDVFERFRNKSEPTWLLASKGKLVNGAFGSNVPELMDLISRELDIERRTREHGAEKCGRIYYELNEMTPVELKRFNAKRSRDEECERIEREAAQHRRHEYLTFVTDQIMAKASDLGASIFMPHVISRDLMKRLTEPADKCQLAAKDKKTIRLAPEHVEVIEMDGQKPMPQYLLDEIGSNDVFMVCWKLTESNGDSCKTVEDALADFSALLWNPEPIDESSPTEISSLLRSKTVSIDAEPAPDVAPKKDGDDDTSDADDEHECVYDAPESRIKVQIPPVWVPSDKRTNAGLIYLYFRSLTESFLPPDPAPERPHLAFAFDAYKRKDIMDIIDANREDILAYGYFTSDSCTATELIANSTFLYQQRTPTIHDKIVLKVVKYPESKILATLRAHGPSHVSENAEIGRVECLTFFPVGYKNASETGKVTPIPTEDVPKKKKKKRKTKQDADASDATDGPQEKTPDDSVANNGQLVDKETSEILDDDDDDDDDDENGNGEDIGELDVTAPPVDE